MVVAGIALLPGGGVIVVEDNSTALIADHIKLGGEDYAPEGTGWFKPHALCPNCGTVLIAWNDIKLAEMIIEHCKEVGCALPQL